MLNSIVEATVVPLNKEFGDDYEIPQLKKLSKI